MNDAYHKSIFFFINAFFFVFLNFQKTIHRYHSPCKRGGGFVFSLNTIVLDSKTDVTREKTERGSNYPGKFMKINSTFYVCDFFSARSDTSGSFAPPLLVQCFKNCFTFFRSPVRAKSIRTRTNGVWPWPLNVNHNASAATAAGQNGATSEFTVGLVLRSINDGESFAYEQLGNRVADFEHDDTPTYRAHLVPGGANYANTAFYIFQILTRPSHPRTSRIVAWNRFWRLFDAPVR